MRVPYDWSEIDATSPIPVYFQLYESLRTHLGSGQFPVGAKLATERSMAQAAGVSRQTVRQALKRLEHEGRVCRRQGDGTYVSESPVESRLRLSRGFTSELSARGLRVSSRMLDFRLARPTNAVAEVMGIAGRSQSAVMLRRTRTLDGIPATVETVWLPAERCRVLLNLDMSERSLYATLHDLVGIDPAHATETITATALGEFEAAELEQRPGAPALAVDRITRDADGRCFEVARSLLRADRFAITAARDLRYDTVVVPGPSDKPLVRLTLKEQL